MENLDQTFKSETKTIKFLLKTFFFCVHLAIMTEIVIGLKFNLILKLIFFIYLARPYYKTIKHRYYTYWTFSFCILFYVFFNVYENFFISNHIHIALLYLFSSLVLMLKMYFLSSPIYYPRVSWWEYDFRYRDDLKIKVKIGETEYDARLTDLRRHAGCVGVFEEIKLGDEIIINANVDDLSVNLRGQVMTKRRDLIGRPLIYGVLFKFDGRSNKKRYQDMVQIWKREKNSKKKLKFANV